MLDRERFLKVSELDAAKIKEMEDDKFRSFTVVASSFTETFPVQEDNIKNALRTKDVGALTKSLAIVCDMLRQLQAERLAVSCASRLATAGAVSYEELQAFAVEFLKAVSALSIDLQMVEYQDASKDSPERGRRSEGNNSILAVDDRHFFLNALKNMLQHSGYMVTCVNSGAAALNFLKIQRPGLFILDIEMPDMDGYELARRIKEAGHTAPIIFLTGNAHRDYVVKALQAGAADFIVKPVTKAQLFERIEKYIQPAYRDSREDE